MSAVKRYTPEPYDGAEMVVRPDGWYVNASDFDALRSERDDLSAMCGRISQGCAQMQTERDALKSQNGALVEAARAAADYLAELYAKYGTKIGPFSSQAQIHNGALRAALSKVQP